MITFPNTKRRKAANRPFAAMALAAAACANFSMAQAADGTVAFAGVDGREQSIYGYVGAVHHYSGDFVGDGVLVRAFGLYGQYNYDSRAVVGGNVEGEFEAFDVMGGYQQALRDVYLRGYVGLDFENHDLSPKNPFDSNRGSDFGVKVQGEAETGFNRPYYGGLIASYGSAKDRYWVRARGGYNFGKGIIGPEAVVTGNHETDQQRFGAFLTLINLGPFWLSVSSGYTHMQNNYGGDGAYGTFELSKTF